MAYKVLFVFGTRPEAIKLAPLIGAMQKSPSFNVRVCVTGQHRQMLDQVLRIFRIQPDYDLNVMTQGQTLFQITSRIISDMEGVLLAEKPDLLIVQGDTTTTLTAALAAYYTRTPVAHVEAGLRTNNKFAPFPEEVNRRITSVIADLHFAPTEWARENLIKEGVSPKKIHVTGNTVIDALFQVVGPVRESGPKFKALFDGVDFSHTTVLITGHRRENFGTGFKNICNAIAELAGQFKEVQFIYPVHLNPNVQKPVNSILKGVPNIHLIPPLDYEPFIYAMDKSYIVLTDSGGVQEEAPSLGKPVLVMRDTTERPEGVEAGTVRLVGTDQAKIIEGVNMLLTDTDRYEQMSRVQNPYGDGKASQRIVEILEKNLGLAAGGEIRGAAVKKGT